MTIDHEDLIAEARRIVPGVALSVQDLIPDGEARHGCIISDGAAVKEGVVSAFKAMYRLADALESTTARLREAERGWRATARTDAYRKPKPSSRACAIS